MIGALALVLALSYFDPRFRFLLVAIVVVLVVLASYELFRVGLGSTRRYLNALIFAALISPSLVVLFYLGGKGLPLIEDQAEAVIGVALLSWYCVTMLVALVSVFSVRQSLGELDLIFRKSLSSLVLVGLGGASLAAIAAYPGSTKVILFLVAVVAANDTAAYFTGIKFGQWKSTPLVSPNKTWIGHFAGLLVGTVTAVAFSSALPLPKCFFLAATIGSMIVLSAQAGDLLKSYVKRLHEVKDFGSILPGHGGILDRIDGVLAGAPVLALSLLAFRYVS